MASYLTPEDISSRLKNYHRDGYLYIGSILKGVTYAASTFVLLQIISDLPVNGYKFPLWLASMFLAIVSYATWGRGALLANEYGNIWDSVLPLFLGILEFMLFGILSETQVPEDLNSSYPLSWRFWFPLVIVYHIVAACITSNRLKNTQLARDFAPELRTLGEKNVIWIKRDFRGAIVCGIVGLGLTILVYMLKEKCNWCSWLSLIFCITSGVVIFNAEKQRKYISIYLSDLYDSKTS